MAQLATCKYRTYIFISYSHLLIVMSMNLCILYIRRTHCHQPDSSIHNLFNGDSDFQCTRPAQVQRTPYGLQVDLAELVRFEGGAGNHPGATSRKPLPKHRIQCQSQDSGGTVGRTS